MINEDCEIADESVLDVLEGISLHGEVNVSDDILLDNVRSAIRRPFPQIRTMGISHERVVLVGGGPSLNDTEDELVELVREGASLVTVNGSYQWCLDHNLSPHVQIVMDARPSNARFVSPMIPKCKYVLASQCAPETWDAVEGRPNVWIFHAAIGSTGPLKELLDAHYLKQWFGVGGGVTVITRALSLLRTLGYLRFDLFGVDSCFMGKAHHAYEQAENEKDKAFPFDVCPPDRPDLLRTFMCAPWHAKQLECLLQMIRVNGDSFLIEIHGDGLLAYMLKNLAEPVVNKLKETV